MGDERIEVLRMVAEKKITVEEAERLLRALDESDRRREPSPRPEGRGFGFFGLGALRDLGEMIRGSVEDAVSGLGFDFDAEHDGVEELVPVRDGHFEVPPGSKLSIKQKFHADLELVSGSGATCAVEGVTPSVVHAGGRFIIKLGKAEGKTARVQVPSTAADLKAFTPGGRIRATGLTCPATLTTMGGELSLVQLRQSFEAHTMGGRIFLDLYPELAADSAVETAGGSIEVAVPRGLRARLVAVTFGGKVKVDPELGEAVSRDTFGLGKTVVDLGSAEGRPRAELRLKTLGGNVHVRRSGE